MLKPGWAAATDARTGSIIRIFLNITIGQYYYHVSTREVTWKKPVLENKNDSQKKDTKYFILTN